MTFVRPVVTRFVAKVRFCTPLPQCKELSSMDRVTGLLGIRAIPFARGGHAVTRHMFPPRDAQACPFGWLVGWLVVPTFTRPSRPPPPKKKINRAEEVHSPLRGLPLHWPPRVVGAPIRVKRDRRSRGPRVDCARDGLRRLPVVVGASPDERRPAARFPGPQRACGEDLSIRTPVAERVDR